VRGEDAAPRIRTFEPLDPRNITPAKSGSIFRSRFGRNRDAV
jgi:hypothetical protein